MGDRNGLPAGWSDGALDDVIALMRQEHGKDISCYEESFLAKTLEKRRQALASARPAVYLERLAADPAEAEELCRALLVTYSEFFRNPLAFALLEQLVLPSLIEEKARKHQGEIRVWSAGCAGGQEAWSVAMLLAEFTDCQQQPVPFRIFATDVAAAELATGRKGVYGPEAVGNIRFRHLRAYFSQQGGAYAVVPRLRDRVEFSAYDLLDAGTVCPPPSIYGHFDLVLCSNLLLYYRAETKPYILNKVHRCLATGGYLVTGEAERWVVEGGGGFRTVAPPASVFQKIGEAKGG